MKVNILRNSLLEKITVVNRICPKKSDLSVLNFFKLEARNEKLNIFATDLEISYQASILAKKIEEEGEVLIPAKQFYEVLQNFFEEDIILEKKENTILIKSKSSISNLPGISEEDYPLIPSFNTDNYFEVESRFFEICLEKIYGNIKTANVIKPEFAGVYMWIDQNYIRLVTTDTIRLSEIKFKKDLVITNIDSGTKILIPERIITEYLKIKKKPLKLRIYLEKSQITFDLDDQVLLTKLLTIDYPDYQQVIPKDFNLIIYLKRDEVLSILKLNKIFTDQTKEVKLKIYPQEKILEFYSKNELLGESLNKTEIEIEKSDVDEPLELSFNIDFFYEGIKNIDSEKVFLGINIPNEYGAKPILLKSPLEEDFIYILMPI